MLRFVTKMPVILVLVVCAALALGDFIPVGLQQGFYTFSLVIKEILVFLLPFIIFSLLFGSVVNLGGEEGTLKFIILLLVCVCCSNFLTTWVSYFIGSFVVENVDTVSKVAESTRELNPLLDFKLPNLIKNEYALLSAVVFGILFSHFRSKDNNFANKLSAFATRFLNKTFIPIVPLFVLGFVLKLNYDGVLASILKNFLLIFGLVLGSQIIYILFLFGLSSNFNLRTWWFRVKNTLPAFITGFSTMSSAATLPITLMAAEKNTHNPTLSRVVIPATVNIHLIGDCIAIPMFALAILNAFGMPLPSVDQYLIFSLFFVVAKFAVAAVPAGGIIVMLPILQQYLGFNSEMLPIITALYILFDSFITGMNVAGNSAFAVIFNKINKAFKSS